MYRKMYRGNGTKKSYRAQRWQMFSKFSSISKLITSIFRAEQCIQFHHRFSRYDRRGKKTFRMPTISILHLLKKNWKKLEFRTIIRRRLALLSFKIFKRWWMLTYEQDKQPKSTGWKKRTKRRKWRIPLINCTISKRKRSMR